MKLVFSKIDKISIFITGLLIIGILSSFYDFGIVSLFFSITMPILCIILCFFAVYGIIKKKYFHLIGIILFLLFFNFFFQVSIEKNSNPIDTIGILTYNVKEFKHPISDKSKQDTSTEIINFIDSLNADILVFQESSYKDGIKLKDYPHYFLGYRENVDKSLLAIYSKYPIINEGYIDFEDSKNNAIYADIKIHNDTIRVYNLHLQSFVINQHILANEYKSFNFWENIKKTNTKQIDQALLIKNHVDNSNKKVIICGDFNATPYSYAYRILKKGMDDTYKDKGNGFGTTLSILNYPLRLDYFLYNNYIKVLSHDNFTLNLSDHEPVFMKFKIK